MNDTVKKEWEHSMRNAKEYLGEGEDMYDMVPTKAYMLSVIIYKVLICVVPAGIVHSRCSLLLACPWQIMQYAKKALHLAFLRCARY